ncbi:methyltransferase, TIGR00027 family [Chitinophaga jiangningensis]|uniref:S-adenosyl-L-methionine-dependent methyltransferase n=1 Tax=Chitinophaga jiangningensis TaxID=1419482 RepID=A0A1M6VFA0_9BACT|nr:SAM-dependent methyltransferase [Chitinophaga jiangningensis]SHK80034.1 methyltransferase, TIGR00027 family [Chitinophaga jiangningensis]
MSWKHGGRATIFMALSRAIESTAPVHKRLLYDPFAAAFLSPLFQKVIACCHYGPLRKITTTILQLRWPGAYTAAVARTRLIDDMIHDAVNNQGINQVIIINARLDTRAHRLKTSIPVQYVEVDLKESQLQKQEILFNVIPEQVTSIDYVPVDIHTQRLSSEMITHLQREYYKTLFLWEGVTSSLKAKEIDEFFEYVTRYPAGTQIILTYLHKAAVENPDNFRGFRAVSRTLGRKGEHFNFGVYPDTWASIFNARNMQVNYDGGASDYRRQYYKEAAKHMKGYEYFRVVRAALK